MNKRIKKKVRKTSKNIHSYLLRSGLLLVFLTGGYHYFFRDIHLEFIQPIGRAYEFSIINRTFLDKTISSLRISAPPQRVIYETTKDIALPTDENGLPIPPSTYVPAVEFDELDNQIIMANTSTKFRVPPLSSTTWLEPKATIIDIKIEVISSSSFFMAIDKVFELFGMSKNKKNYRYLVIDNYWNKTNSNSLEEAIRIYCRDNGTDCNDHK